MEKAIIGNSVVNNIRRVLCMPSKARITIAEGTACKQKAVKLSVREIALIKKMLNKLINKNLGYSVGNIDF